MSKPLSKRNRRPDNMRNVFAALIVEVCEGDGTEEYPLSIQRYVVTHDGSILGKINYWNNYEKN